VLADSGRGVGAQRGEEADGAGLGGELADGVLVGPAEGGYLGQRESGYVSKPGRVPTLAEWMAGCLDVLCERLVLSEKMAPRTLADYRSKTRNWTTPLLGKHRLDRLTPEHLDGAYAVMLRHGLSPSTVLKVHRILSRALRIAVRRGQISRNVATLMDAPRWRRMRSSP
jgi:hypothetical protein